MSRGDLKDQYREREKRGKREFMGASVDGQNIGVGHNGEGSGRGETRWTVCVGGFEEGKEGGGDLEDFITQGERENE